MTRLRRGLQREPIASGALCDPARQGGGRLVTQEWTRTTSCSSQFIVAPKRLHSLNERGWSCLVLAMISCVCWLRMCIKSF